MNKDVRTAVQFHDEQDMDFTSSLSAADYLQKLPITGSAINRLNNSSGNLGFPPDGAGIGAGAAEIDLRSLGSKRTLVLVDGRRWIRGSSASGVSGAVDINSIPNNAVKSIEISLDGASTVYGSDAIAGVVNIITQDDYSSFKASAYYGSFEEGDGESLEVDVRWGAETERARVLFDVSWTDQNEVMAGDRDISEYAIQGFPFGLSSGTPEGRLVFTDPRTGETLSITSDVANPFYNPTCWIGGETPGCDDFHSFTLEDRFNWQPFNFLLTPNKRVSVFSKAEYDITDNTMFRVLASFNKRESTSQAAPEPLFFGPDAGAGQILDNLFWPADHPTNPFGIDMGPDNLVFTGRRPIEAGPRIFEQDVETWYVSAGVDGSFANDIYWDATVIFSENDATQIKHGAFNAQNIAIALGPTDVCAATFAFGANWAPTDNLVFRANYAEGFRAPNIGELFNTGSRFDASIVDPCSNVQPGLQDNCTALGVPPGFVQPNPQISVTTGGNPGLTPETSDTFTAGFSWNVPFADNWDSIDGLLLELNYYDIEVNNAIQPPDAQDVLKLCVDTLDPFFCNNIVRGPGGSVLRVDGVLLNIGGIETSGLDWKVELTTADSSFGQFRFQWLNTYLLDYTEIVQGPDGEVRISREGTELGSPERAFVEFKSTLNIDWFYHNWSARIAFQYLDSLQEECGGMVAAFELFDDFCSRGRDGNDIDSTLFTNLQASWQPDLGGEGQWNFQLGVNNVFEETTPFCASCDLNSFDGTLYPIPGRFWYARVVFEIE